MKARATLGFCSARSNHAEMFKCINIETTKASRRLRGEILLKNKGIRISM